MVCIFKLLYRLYPDQFPKIYINSLNFYSPNANLSEAIIAILESAESSSSLSQEMLCDVAGEAAKLGMIKAIESLDVSSCDLTIPEVDYKQITNKNVKTQSGIIESATGCGVIGNTCCSCIYIPFPTCTCNDKET